MQQNEWGYFFIDDHRKNPDEIAPRRPKPSIKFLTDVEPVVIETSVNKRGLLRAPTPYPKELRALAKHASHIRQSKEHNGDVLNTVNCKVTMSPLPLIQRI